LKHFLPGTFLIALLTFPIPSIACSMASCLGNGDEMRPDFVVRITFVGKPLPGVNVQITGTKSFSATSSIDGTVHVGGLPSGDYWVNTELSGIGAGGQCFHVGNRASRKAKRTLTYEWGNLAPSTRRIVGRIIDPAPGEGTTFLQNIRNGVIEPIPEARLKLQNPLTGDAYTTQSDRDGEFSFGQIPSGTYILHVESGMTLSGRAYEPTDLLIRVSNTATHDTLLLKRTSGGGGSCGGPSLLLAFQNIPN
jgi:hypothetical protein